MYDSTRLSNKELFGYESWRRFEDRMMRVETNNNLVFDDSDKLCFCTHSSSQGEAFAFVQCLDVGMDGLMRNPKRYWGKWDSHNPEDSMKAIMEHGGKWPKLPA